MYQSTMSSAISFEQPSQETGPLASTKASDALRSLFHLVGAVAFPLEDKPAQSLLHNEDIATHVTMRIRDPLSGTSDDEVCQCLYDSFSSSDPDLLLLVLQFIPTLCGVYLSRAPFRPLAGFEAVLLAIYAHETKARGGQAITVTIPDISHPSLYHETTKRPGKNAATELRSGVISPSLEPQSTVRATKRAAMVGVALELYYSKVSLMPLSSKIEFCKVCMSWSGMDDDTAAGANADCCREEPETSSVEGSKLDEGVGGKEESGRIHLPWELWQPIVRLLGHCLLAPMNPAEVKAVAQVAIRRVHSRAHHDLNPRAILATQSLLNIANTEIDPLGHPSPSDSLHHLEPDPFVFADLADHAKAISR